ncbi:MAG: transcriptional regulator, TetR family [Acidobacteriales bacterium]|nr:transcriptional regulator, TetR family [Terriglobales bacterium]
MASRRPASSAPKDLTNAPQAASARERILSTAKRLFAKQGYDHTSTVAIARVAGTSESQVMKHFGSKEGLLEEIFNAGWEEMSYNFRAIHELHSPTEKLEVILELILAALERDPELKVLMLLEGRRIRKEGHIILLTKGYLRFIGVLDAILLEMRALGELRMDVELDAVRSALNSIFEGMLRDQVLAERMGYPAKYGRSELVRMFHIVLSAFVVKPPRV